MERSNNRRPRLSREDFIAAIREYKEKHGITRPRLSDQELDEAIREFLDEKNNNDNQLEE